MKINDTTPVFLQIKLWLEDNILRGDWSVGTQLPSVRELAAEFGVMSIPTLVVIKDGQVVSNEPGARPKSQILAMLEG